MFLFLQTSLFAQSDSLVDVGKPENLFQLANQAYKNEDFQKAGDLYLQIMERNKESSEVYFNLGNVYYKLGEIPKAILYYEKAKKLSPKDEDLAINLEMANLKTIDKVESKPELAVNLWWQTLINLATVDEWASKSIYLAYLALASFLLFIVSKGLLKRIGFFGGIVIFTLSLFFYLLANQQNALQTSEKYGIIFTPSVTVKSAPEEDGTKIFVIHEGTKVQVLGQSGDWSNISLMNGNKGWIKKVDYEGI